jgi:hypothetical protein
MNIKTSFISYICNQITNIEVKMVLEIRLSNMFSFRDEVTSLMVLVLIFLTLPYSSPFRER